MSDPTTANSLFTALTLVANLAFLALVVVGCVSLTGDAGRRASGRVVARLGPTARPLALVVAAVTTLGSLYYSEVVGYIPCDLCWYQRVLMYPLAVVLAVGVIRRDRAVLWYSAPFVVIGAPLALYHWLVERVPSLAEGSSCAVFVPCSVPYFEELGYVTLAFMDLSAFLLIGALLLLGRAHDRTPQEA